MLSPKAIFYIVISRHFNIVNEIFLYAFMTGLILIMVRFLKLVEPALQLLPEVAMPERKVCVSVFFLA